MTDKSLFVLAYPEVLPFEELKSASLTNAVVERLDQHARECGPYKLSNWADTKDLPVFYVDNCWVRVPVSGELLREFYSTVLGLDAASDISRRASDTTNYLIEAEEF